MEENPGMFAVNDFTRLSNDIADSFVVTLDKRPLKTPAGTLLKIPKSKRLLASMIAHEWDNQETLIKPFALPMVCIFT